MNELFTKELLKTLKRAYNEAQRRRHEYVTLEHLLYALTFDEAACDVLLHTGADIQRLGQRVKKFIDKELMSITIADQKNQKEVHPQYTIGFQSVLQIAVAHSQGAEPGRLINGANLIASLFRHDESHAVMFLEEEGITRLDVVRYISHGISRLDELDNHQDSDLRADPELQAEAQRQSKTKSSYSHAKETQRDPLQRFCTHLNAKALAKKIDPLIGRQRELERCVHILARRRKNNPILVGDAGVGKTAIVEGLATKIVEGSIPPSLQNREIYSLDMGALLAGTRYRGEFEERIKAVMQAIQKKPEIILFIDEIHTIIGAGAVSGGALDASNLLKPALANGEVSCIGTTTYKEYRSIFEKDHALSRRFQKIEVSEPSHSESVRILQGLQKRYEDYHKVKYSLNSLRAAVELSRASH